MPVLHLPVCPICGAHNSLVRQVPDPSLRARTTYTCWECGSVLGWLGDELWVQSDRWAYQRVTREDKQYLLHRPLSVEDLHQLADTVPPTGSPATDSDSRPDVIEVEVGAPPDADGGWVPSTPSQGTRPDEAADPARRTRSDRDSFGIGRGEADALVPLAQVLPDGLTLALIQYDGSQAVPVAVFEEGQLRSVPFRPRRGRGSPLLLISVTLTLLCLLCSAGTVVLSSLLGGSSLSAMLPLPMVAPLVSPTTTATPVPTLTPLPTVTPTAEPTSTPTPVPTDTPLPSPTPLPPPTEVVPVPLHGVSEYTGSDGSQVIVGEVLNHTGSHLRFVEIMASFHDAEGRLLGTGSAFVELTTVEIDGRAPFRLVIQDPPPSSYNYSLHVDFIPTEHGPLYLSVDNHSARKTESGAFQVTGQVRNPRDFPIKFAEVVATFYNAEDRVIRVETTQCEQEVVEAGQMCQFDLTLEDPPADLSHYKLQSQAIRQ
jgi:hypothetical protein